MEIHKLREYVMKKLSEMGIKVQEKERRPQNGYYSGVISKSRKEWKIQINEGD